MDEWRETLKLMFEKETGEKWIIEGETDDGGYFAQRNRRQFIWFEQKLKSLFELSNKLTAELSQVKAERDRYREALRSIIELYEFVREGKVNEWGETAKEALTTNKEEEK